MGVRLRDEERVRDTLRLLSDTFIYEDASVVTSNRLALCLCLLRGPQKQLSLPLPLT